ncbi:MAG: hypothetical protein JNN13_20080 [Planctomycetes bacterium]|nr:hypothetical protein [Planctomycetota bacterium]
MPTMLRCAAAIAALSTVASLPAQLPVNLLYSFVDTVPGGGGYIGVAQDELTLDIFVIAFSNPQSVHHFDAAGNVLGTAATTVCTPSLPSPNDITYDVSSDSLWLVDNTGGKVLNMSKAGGCLGGWQLPAAVSNPVGICFDRASGTLFISQTGAVMQYSPAGTLLGGGFSFVPPTGSSILSAIAYVPATDHFLIAQSSGTQVYEVDRAGVLLSTTPLASYGIVNIQGLYYNPTAQLLLVEDNTLATTFVFSLASCAGSLQSIGTGCLDSGNQQLVLSASGCPDLGDTVTLHAMASATPFPMLLAGGATQAQFDLGLIGGPTGCFLYQSSEAVVSMAPVGGVAVVPFGIPANPTLAGAQVFLQMFVLDPLLPVPLPLASSNAVALTVQ